MYVRQVTSDEPILTYIRDILAVNLRRHRKNQGLSQTEVATRANVDRAYISALERSQHAATIDVVGRLALALGLNPNDLMIPPELHDKPDWTRRACPKIGPDRQFIVQIPLSTLPVSECSALLLSFLAYPEISSAAYQKRTRLEEAICNSVARKRAASDPDWGLHSQVLRPNYLLISEEDTEKALRGFRKQASNRFVVAKAIGDLVSDDPEIAWMKAPEGGHQLCLAKMAESIAPFVGDKEVANILSRVFAPGFAVVHVALALDWLQYYGYEADNIDSIVQILCSDKDPLDSVLRKAEVFRAWLCLNLRTRGSVQSMIQFEKT